MRAAVTHEPGATPKLEQYPEPEPTDGTIVGKLIAASLNPLYLAIVNGFFPLRRLEQPNVAGYEAVVELPTGERRYVAGPPLPYGSLGELVPFRLSESFSVPRGLDPGLAASLGVSGLSAWIGLTRRARMQIGETVLVFGAGGSVGQLATQAARILGAGRIIAATRRTGLKAARDRGADSTIDLTDFRTLDGELTAVAPNGYDVVIDLLWGEAISPVIAHANIGARIVQIGNSVGPMSTISALNIRNKLITTQWET